MGPTGTRDPNGDTTHNPGPGLINPVLSPPLFWVYDDVFKSYAQKISRFKQKEEPSVPLLSNSCTSKWLCQLKKIFLLPLLGKGQMNFKQLAERQP